MAFQLDSRIPLGVIAPAINDPVAVMGQVQRVASERQQMQEDQALAPLRQQQAEQNVQLGGLNIENARKSAVLGDLNLADAQRKAEVDKRNFDEDKTYYSAFAENGGDFEKTNKDLQGKVSLETLNRHAAAYAADVKGRMDLDEIKWKEGARRNTLFGDAIVGLTETPVGELATAWPATLARLKAQGVDTGAADPAKPPTPEELRTMAINVGYNRQLDDASKRQRVKAAEAATDLENQKFAYRRMVAERFDGSVVKDAASWKAYADALPEDTPVQRDTKNEYKSHVWDPTKTPEFVRTHSMTSQERAAERKAMVAKTTSKEELAVRAASGDAVAARALNLLLQQERAGKNDPDELTPAQKRLRVNDLQTQVDNYETQKATLDHQKKALGKENEGLGAEWRELGKDATPAEITRIKNKIAANNEEIKGLTDAHANLVKQQKSINDSKTELMGGGAPKADPERPIRYDAQGQGVQWDGKAWQPLPQR